MPKNIEKNDDLPFFLTKMKFGRKIWFEGRMTLAGVREKGRGSTYADMVGDISKG